MKCSNSDRCPSGPGRWSPSPGAQAGICMVRRAWGTEAKHFIHLCRAEIGQIWSEEIEVTKLHHLFSHRFSQNYSPLCLRRWGSGRVGGRERQKGLQLPERRERLTKVRSVSSEQRGRTARLGLVFPGSEGGCWCTVHPSAKQRG